MSANKPALLFIDEVTEQWLHWHREGRNPVLVTILAIEGSSPRPLGAQMAVAGETEAVGYLTGGCLEQAIVADALASRASGQRRLVRFGEGSPYLDLKLPCGSGIDLLFEPQFPPQLAEAILRAGRERQPVHVRHAANEEPCLVTNRGASPGQGAPGALIRRHDPPLRLLLPGKGPVLPLLAQMAWQSDYRVSAYSPDPATLELAAPWCESTQQLRQPGRKVAMDGDPWTALVTLFHEHEWETAFLAAALNSELFYIGAMGSRRTQEERLAVLSSMGFSEQQLVRINGPAGVFHSAQRPPDIAVSIMGDLLHHRPTD